MCSQAFVEHRLMLSRPARLPIYRVTTTTNKTEVQFSSRCRWYRSMRSEKPLCAPHRLSEVSLTSPLKRFQKRIIKKKKKKKKWPIRVNSVRLGRPVPLGWSTTARLGVYCNAAPPLLSPLGNKFQSGISVVPFLTALQCTLRRKLKVCSVAS